MEPALTETVITLLLAGSTSLQPSLQIVKLDLVPSTKTSSTRYHVSLSDGACQHKTLLSSAYNGHVASDDLKHGSIIILRKATCTFLQNCVDGAIPGIILLMGGHLIKGLRSSKLRPVTTVLIICVKFALLPIIGIFVVKGASHLGLLPTDPLYHYVLMVQYTVPPAMSIGTIAQLFNVGEQDCSVLFLAAFAVTFWSTVYMWILFS